MKSGLKHKRGLFLFLFSFFSVAVWAERKEEDFYLQRKTDVVHRVMHRIELEYRPGYIFPTNSFVAGRNVHEKQLRYYKALHARYAFQASSGSETDRIFGGVYQGIGLGYNMLGDVKELGNPLAFYLFQGARIFCIAQKLSLNYEWNFGLSFGWKPYDSKTNSLNTIIGSKINAYLNTNFYLNWVLSSRWDLTTGITLTHFSNGNTSFPNAGLNMIDAKIGLVYYFNRQEATLWWGDRRLGTDFSRHVSYDLVVFGSWRRKGYFQAEEFIPSPKAYQVVGTNLSAMYHLSYKFRTGVALDWVYDASSNVFVKSDPDTPSGFVDPPFNAQIALGVSGRAEYVMPFFTIGVGMGINVIHRGGDLRAFYQMLILKIAMTRNSFLHVGYNLKEFRDPNFLMLGIGYRFNNKYPKKL